MAGVDPPTSPNTGTQAITFNNDAAIYCDGDAWQAIASNSINDTSAYAGETIQFIDGGTAANMTYTVTNANTITFDQVTLGSGVWTNNGIYYTYVNTTKPWVRAYNKLKWWAGWYERRRDRIIRERNNVERKQIADKAEALARSLLEELFELVPGEKFIRVLSEKFDNREYRIPLDGDLPQVWIDGKLDHKICISTSYSFRLPKSDVAAARALLVSTSEEEFLKIGNKVRTF